MASFGDRHQSGTAMAVPLLIFLFVFGIYLRTMAPGVYGVDSAEVATGAYTLGIVHQPGYPTYLLLGKLFTLLPIGDIAYRLNLMSGFFAALTVSCAYLLCQRLSCTVIASLTASLLLAFSFFFWADSVVAEVYTLYTAFLTVLILILLRWRESHNPMLLLALAFLYGLSFGSHTSAMLLAPGIAAFVLLNRDRQDSIILTALRMFPCFLLGLAVFAYLPIRQASGALNLTGSFDASGQLHSADLTTWEGLRWFVGGERFRSLMFSYDLIGLAREGLRYLGWLWSTFAGLGLVLGTVGFIEWTANRRKDAIATALFFVFPLVFFLDYSAVDKETMFLPTYVIWTIWIGAGVDALLETVRKAVQGTGTSYITILARATVLLIPLLALVLNFRYVDVSQDRRAGDWASAMLNEAAPNAIIIGWYNDTQPMLYLQQVQGIRPDVFVLSETAIGKDDLGLLLRDRISTTAIYSAADDSSLRACYELQPLARGYRLLPRVPTTEQCISKRLAQ